MSERLPRREFLKKTGGAVSAGFLGGSVLTNHASGGAPGAIVKPSAGFDHVGVWYFLPSFFEYSLGPWQPTMPSNPDLVGLWKQTIDWYADNGLNFIVIQLGPYGGKTVPIGADRVRHGWGYHYVLNFDKFPEARCTTDNPMQRHPDAQPFEPDSIKRNQEIVRAVTDYGKEKGVAVYTHHYNFLAPTTFVDANRDEILHLEVLKKGVFKDIPKLACWDMPVALLRRVLEQADASGVSCFMF